MSPFKLFCTAITTSLAATSLTAETLDYYRHNLAEAHEVLSQCHADFTAALEANDEKRLHQLTANEACLNAERAVLEDERVAAG